MLPSSVTAKDCHPRASPQHSRSFRVSASVPSLTCCRNWEPVYNVLFNKQKYLDAFLYKLRTQGGLRRGATLEQLDATAAQFVVPDGG